MHRRRLIVATLLCSIGASKALRSHNSYDPSAFLLSRLDRERPFSARLEGWASVHTVPVDHAAVYWVLDSPPLPSVPVLRTARAHPMRYYISLPSSWTRSRRWPVVFVIDGGNKEWLESARAFAKVRDEKHLPFIIVTPLVLTNGGGDFQTLRHLPVYSYSDAVWDSVARIGRCAFDIGGLNAIMDEVRADYSAEDKSFLTGWSAGGNLAWAMVFRQPEKLAGAALTCANFGKCVTKEVDPRGEGADTVGAFSAAPERVTLPVKIFDADNDPQFKAYVAQNLSLLVVAQEHGYERVSHHVVRGADHSPMPEEVLLYFYALLKPQPVHGSR